MSATRFAAVRDTLVSAAGSALLSAVLIAAAVLPAQGAIAATLGL